MTIVYAFLLYRATHGKTSISIKDFRRSIALEYLKTRHGKRILKARPLSFTSISSLMVLGMMNEAIFSKNAKSNVDANIQIAQVNHLHFAASAMSLYVPNAFQNITKNHKKMVFLLHYLFL